MSHLPAYEIRKCWDRARGSVGASQSESSMEARQAGPVDFHMGLLGANLIEDPGNPVLCGFYLCSTQC